jgi:hypothetical protein
MPYPFAHPAAVLPLARPAAACRAGASCKARQLPRTAPRLSVFGRSCVIAGALGAMAIAALWTADARFAFDYAALKHLLRTAGLAALQALAIAIFLYCLLWQLRKVSMFSP